MIAGPRSQTRYRPTTTASAKAIPAIVSADRSLIRPLTMAWLARGLVIESTPFRTSYTSLTMFVPAWRNTAPRSAAMNGGQFHSSSTQASAAPASTGITEAVKANGRRISYRAPARRPRRSPSAELSVVGEARRHAGPDGRGRHAGRGPAGRRDARRGHAADDDRARLLDGRRLRDRGEDRRRGDQLVDLAVLLEDRLEQRQLEPGLARGTPSRRRRRPRACRTA